jgi:hypothetical protein
MSAYSGKKPPGHFSLSFFQKQKMEKKTKQNHATYWNSNPWKAYLYPSRPNPVPVNVCLEKSHPPFLPLCQIQSCLHKSANQMSEHHAPSSPPHLNIIQHSSWAD